MGQNTAIEWTDVTWNPTRGCSRVSEGCRNCYAEAIAARFSRSNMGPGEYTARREAKDLPPFFGFAQQTEAGPRWTGKVELIWDKLAEPQHWHEPKRIFVNSMSDLFHEKLSNTDIAHVFKTMHHENHHTYQILTKRAERLPELMPRLVATFGLMPHVWLGVSVENCDTKIRIDLLRDSPAALRFLSLEPLLEDLGELNLEGISWVIIGGESGPGARPCRISWVRSIIAQCRKARVPVFVKQLGARPIGLADEDLLWLTHITHSKGGDWDEWPSDLRIREFPVARITGQSSTALRQLSGASTSEIQHKKDNSLGSNVGGKSGSEKCAGRDCK